GFGGAGSGALVHATVDRTTEAYVGTRAGTAPSSATNLTFANGDVLVQAVSHLTASTSPVSLGVAGGIAVAATVTNATVNGTTRAYIGQKTTLVAGELDVLANSTEVASANTKVVELADGASAEVGT